jgi:cytochrome c oxidase subunit IV
MFLEGHGMADLAKVSKYNVALLVANGVVWVIPGVIFGGMVAVAYPSIGSLVKAGVGAAGYPADAVRQLAWDQFYINLYAAVIGLFSIMIGLTAFRRGETWAWFSILVLVLNGLITSVFDYLSWGGWYTVFASFPALLALLLSTKSFFPAQAKRER